MPSTIYGVSQIMHEAHDLLDRLEQVCAANGPGRASRGVLIAGADAMTAIAQLGTKLTLPRYSQSGRHDLVRMGSVFAKISSALHAAEWRVVDQALLASFAAKAEQLAKTAREII
jgi:hypothetical protein